MDSYLHITTPTQLQQWVKPLVETMNEELRLMFPDVDLSHTSDAYIRQLPANYELQLWFNYDEPTKGNFELFRLELVIPGRIEHESVALLDWTRYIWSVTIMNVIFDAINRYLRDVGPIRHNPHLLRLRW